MDITLLPTAGFCVPWWPRVLPPVWPFTWHVLLVLDHFSRAVVHTAVFLKNPSETQVLKALGLAAWLAGAPKHLITDRGSQFGAGLLAWCDDNDMKYEFLHAKVLPFSWRRMSEVLRSWQHHYNRLRHHARLGGVTPAEIRDGSPLAGNPPGIETRPRMPCGARRRLPKGHRLELVVATHNGHPELPIVSLRVAAK